MIDHARRKYLGSGDSGPLMAWKRPELEESLAKYQTVADVYMRVALDIHQPQRAVMTRGLTQEPRLRQLYRDSVGPTSEPPGVLLHPTYDWCAGSPDGLVGDDGISEYKTTHIRSRSQWGEPGTDKIPNSYGTQLQWLFAVTGRKWAHLLVAFGQDGKGEQGEPIFSIYETAVYECERDDELCAALMGFGEEFWRTHVLPRVPPTVPSRHNLRQWKRIQKEAANVSSD